jgi:hypothetical protein
MPATRRPLALAAAAALALAAGAAAARAQDAIRIAPAHRPGERWSFEESARQSSRVKIVANGQVTQEIEQQATDGRSGTLEVLEARDGEPVAVRASFGPNCGEHAEKKAFVHDATGELKQVGADPPLDRRYDFAGHTAAIRRTPDGHAQIECDATLGDDRKKLESFVNAAEKGYFPKHPVKPGDRWIADDSALSKAFELKPEDRGVMKCKLRALETVEGRATAVLDIAIAVVKVAEQWIQVQIDMEGTGRVDLETGQMLDLDMRGPITTSGARDVPGQNGQIVKIAVDGTGEAAYRATARPLPPAGPGAAPPPPSGPAPTTGRDWGDAPAASGPDASTPQQAYLSMLAALQANDFEAYKALHTPKAQGELTREGFVRAVALLAEKGPPPVAGFDPGEPGEARVTLKNGRYLTKFVRLGDAWRCDAVWAK